ncbi:hypothetical protein O181_104240 [Austropuccinia psidii MF-1]|uniref:Uncharacterized protein n=1 Tax=Austropuccinia psidii MF-1 TaxID=1389203 RepID=A0A9Q3JJI4_9BASI|nr:hypothetical protein [Austropuccinia psidii MF-1]
MNYSEEEALRQLPEASSWPKVCGVGEYDHMELIDCIDLPSIPDYWITARLNTAFKGHASIWYKEMEEIHGRRPNGAHCSIVAREYLDNHFPNWEKQLLPTKAKSFTSTSVMMTYIGTIIKEIIIAHRKGNIRLQTEFSVLEHAHIQELLLETHFQSMYGI